MQLKLLVEGGNAKPGPSLSQQLGPLGINLGKLIADVNKASEKYKGIKVPVIVEIDPVTKTFTVSLKTPPTSELIKKELALAKGAADSKAKIGNFANLCSPRCKHRAIKPRNTFLCGTHPIPNFC